MSGQSFAEFNFGNAEFAACRKHLIGQFSDGNVSSQQYQLGKALSYPKIAYKQEFVNLNVALEQIGSRTWLGRKHR